MTFDDFAQLVRTLYAASRADTGYLDSLPGQVSEFLVTNPYAESLNAQLEAVCAVAFREHWPDVRWFLQDWRPGFDVIVQAASATPRPYTIHSLDDYLAYARRELFEA